MSARRWVMALALLAAMLAAAGYVFTRPDPMLAVVAVVGENGHGAGFAVDAHTVVTNAHVIDGEYQVQVVTLIGGHAAVTDIWRAENADLAVLTVSPAMPHTLAVRCAWPDRGEFVRAMGHPLAARWAAFRGRVASDVPLPGEKPLVALDIGINSGMSGGPVLDWRNRVVAVTKATVIQRMRRSMSGSHSGVAIPGTTVCTALAQARGAMDDGSVQP